MITVFTSTYNRAYIIENLYQSLCQQSYKDFEWLIIDDGSTDDTEKIVTSLMKKKEVVIYYVKQPNGGKHRAINRGVQLAQGELFFIVDSDDQLYSNALAEIMHYYEDIKYNGSFAGICGLKTFFDGRVVGGEFQYTLLDCSPLDLRLKYHVKGDMAEVFKTDVLKKYPFPTFDGEKFCPEALVWNRISLKYKLRYVNDPIYRCEYRPDGLTAKIVRLRMNNPQASLLYYSELYQMNIPFLQKVKAAINYWRFSFSSHLSFFMHLKQIGFLSLFMYPIGLLFHLRDLRS